MQNGPLPLPDEVNLAISELLPLPSQFALANTCRYFHYLMKDKFIWKKKIDALKAFFPPKSVTCLPTQPNFLMLAKHLHHRFTQEIAFLDKAFPQIVTLIPDNPAAWNALKEQISSLKTLLKDITQDNYLQKFHEINNLLEVVNGLIIEWQLPSAHLRTDLKLEHITRLPALVLSQHAPLFAVLKHFELKDNLLDRLPENIDICLNVYSLNLYDNPISHLPDSLKHLQELKFLYLSGGSISKLPAAIYALKNLQWLAFDHMQLKYIDEDIAKLKNLTWIYMRNNQLTFLPLGFCKLTKLQFLMLDNNELYPLQHPDILHFLEKLGIELQSKKKRKALTSSGSIDALSNQMQFLTLAPQHTATRYLQYSTHHHLAGTGKLRRNDSFF